MTPGLRGNVRAGKGERSSVSTDGHDSCMPAGPSVDFIPGWLSSFGDPENVRATPEESATRDNQTVTAQNLLPTDSLDPY